MFIVLGVQEVLDASRQTDVLGDLEGKTQIGPCIEIPGQTLVSQHLAIAQSQ